MRLSRMEFGLPALLLLLLICSVAAQTDDPAAYPAPVDVQPSASVAAEELQPVDVAPQLQLVDAAVDSAVAVALVAIPQWVSTNPGGGGAFNSPIITRPSRYWAVGSDLSGVYLSKDKGVTWQVLGAAANLTATHIASLCAHPSGKLLIGSDAGIFTAQEDGTNMHKTYADGYISAIAVAASNNVVYAARHPAWNALSPGILRSSDFGETWTLVSTNLPAGLRVVALRTHRVDSNAVLVLSGKGRFATGPAQAWLSIDGGKMFWQIAPQLGDNIMDVAYGTNPQNLNGMFLTTYRNQNTGFLYSSQDAGGNWAQVSGRTGVILVDGANWQHVRLLEVPIQHTDGTWEGQAMMYETFNAGTTWVSYNPLTGFTPGWSHAYLTWGLGSGYQGEVQTFGSDPNSPSTVLWADSQFVYASTTFGRTWAVTVSRQVGSAWRSRGVDNAVPAVVAPSAANSSLVYAGYYDMGLWRSEDGGGSWKSLNDVRFSGGWQDAVGGNTLTVLPDPSRAGAVWAQLGGDLSQQMYLVKSTNRGNTWTQLTSGLPASMTGLQGLSLDPASSSTSRKLYLITNGKVYRSTNDGSSWGSVFTCPSCIITAVIGGTVYAGGGGGLWKSTTGASGSWTAVAGLSTTGWTADKTPRDWGFVGVMDIAAASDGRLWVAVFGKGFYQSITSAGTSWTLVRADIYARTVAAGTTAGQVLTGSSSAYMAGGYDAQSKGVNVYSGTSWSSLNTGLAWPFATMVRVVGGVRWLLSPGQGVLRWQ